MIGNVVLFALGAAWLQQQSALPSVLWSFAFAVACAGYFLFLHDLRMRRARRLIGGILSLCAGFLWAALIAHIKLADYLPEEWEGRDVTVVGVVADLPQSTERGMRFEFDVERARTPLARIPRHVTLNLYNDRNGKATPAIRAGQRWSFTVRLRRPHGLANHNGFDFEAWMLERGIRATGYVRPDTGEHALDAALLQPMVWRPLYGVARAREWVRNRIFHALPDNANAGVLVALAIGDQQAISRDQWTVYTRTGVNHLMSISGLHITMVAGLGFALVLWLWRRAPRLMAHLPAVKAAAVAGFITALAYALMAGYGVPAQRTVYMLGAVAVALLCGLAAAPAVVLALALLVAIVVDPMCVLAPGFWLSFGAVAVIMYVSLGRLEQPQWWVNWLRVQWAVTIGLAPFLVALFQQVSIVSPLANAFAIPLVSLAIVPLTLIGVIVPVDWLLRLAAWLMDWCNRWLAWSSSLPDAVWQQHAPPVWAVVLSLLGAVWLLAPRGAPSRWLGLFAFLPLFFPCVEAPANGELWIDVLDVGQGLSTVVRTRTHALLYDAGPTFSSDTDAGSRVVVPFLRAQGVQRLDGFIVTHDDNDHSGGARSVLEAVPVGWLASSLPAGAQSIDLAKRRLRCFAGQHWEWDGVRFEVLHPTWDSYDNAELRDNARGCVLKIDSVFGSILLPADIELASETELIARRVAQLRAGVLIAPHHGSGTSSSQAFLTAVSPQLVVIPVGYRNRFGHPKPEVLARYRALGLRVLRSDRDGEVALRFTAAGVAAEPYRSKYVRYWQDR